MKTKNSLVWVWFNHVFWKKLHTKKKFSPSSIFRNRVCLLLQVTINQLRFGSSSHWNKNFIILKIWMDIDKLLDLCVWVLHQIFYCLVQMIAWWFFGTGIMVYSCKHSMDIQDRSMLLICYLKLKLLLVLMIRLLNCGILHLENAWEQLMEFKQVFLL